MKVSVIPIRDQKSLKNVYGKYFCLVYTIADINSIIKFILGNKDLNQFEVTVKEEEGKAYELYFFGKIQTKEQFASGLRLMLKDCI